MESQRISVLGQPVTVYRSGEDSPVDLITLCKALSADAAQEAIRQPDRVNVIEGIQVVPFAQLPEFILMLNTADAKVKAKVAQVWAYLMKQVGQWFGQGAENVNTTQAREIARQNAAAKQAEIDGLNAQAEQYQKQIDGLNAQAAGLTAPQAAANQQSIRSAELLREEILAKARPMIEDLARMNAQIEGMGEAPNQSTNFLVSVFGE